MTNGLTSDAVVGEDGEEVDFAVVVTVVLCIADRVRAFFAASSISSNTTPRRGVTARATCA